MEGKEEMIPRFVRRLAMLALFTALVVGSLEAAPAAASLPPTREGCMQQWMFDGIWRVRVTKVEPSLDSDGKQNGWLVTEQWRNGTSQLLEPVRTAVLSQQLVLADGKVISTADSTVATLSEQEVDYHDFPPSAQLSHVQKFLSLNLDPNNKPVAVIIAFDAGKAASNKNGPQFSVRPPNYKIKLTCTATGAAAQGGSREMAAREGCMHQWLSNGIWRMRVAAIGPAMNASGQQFGYNVTEDWVNVTKLKLIASWTVMGDQQLALKNGDTISWGDAMAGVFASQKLVYHEFAPGASFEYVQPFGLQRGLSDLSNTPVKLLVPFDVKRKKEVGGVQYSSGPANFRFNLACSK